MQYCLKLPKTVYSGDNSLDKIIEIIEKTGAKKVAAFTDKSLEKLGLFALIEQRLHAANVPYDVFDDLPAEPTYMAVQNVIDQFKKENYDLIVACGGGSVMDSAKLASILKTDEYGNTATAAAMVAESSSDERIAAICSVDCAEKLGLHIIARDITDCALNRTRFVCISRELQSAPESDAVSVMLKIPHTEGSLYRLLTKFYVNGMNLLRIESRPIKDGSFDVMFYLDFSGRINEPSVKALMNDLAENLEYFRFLGTFRNE